MFFAEFKLALLKGWFFSCKIFSLRLIFISIMKGLLSFVGKVSDQVYEVFIF